MPTLLVCLLAALLVAAVTRWVLRSSRPLGLGVAAALATGLLIWLRDSAQRALEGRWLRKRHRLDLALRRIGQALKRLVEPHQLAKQMLLAAHDSTGAQSGVVYLRARPHDPLRLATRLGGLAVPPELALTHPLIAALRSASFVSVDPSATAASPAEQALRAWNAPLALALEQQGELLGVAVFGEKELSGPYTLEDRSFLVALARTTALALRSAEGAAQATRLQQRLQSLVAKVDEQREQIRFLQQQLLERPTAAPPGAPEAIAAAPESNTDLLRGSSSAMTRLRQQVAKVADSEASVLIRGESGSGKTLLAEALHRQSRRAAGPLVVVHCAALSPSLLESELFGHVKGAFTGADRDRAGRFEQAHGGTLLLDEIGDVSWDVQTKLLRVLQERAFERVGGSQTQRVDVRLVAATHQKLEEQIRRGRFREDLYYRLNVISLVCPALRERPDDIFELSMHFLESLNRRGGKRIARIEEDALDALRAYAWPGNVRQLHNVLERAGVMAEGDALRREDLPPEVLGAGGRNWADASAARADSPESGLEDGSASGPVELAPLAELVELERQKVAAALSRSRGNKSQAARLLGVPRSTLFSKMRKLGLE